MAYNKKPEVMITPIIEFNDVTKIYKNFWGAPLDIGIKKITFSVKEGDTLVLLGPNGSGKTTLIKLLAGLLTPTHGRIMVCKEDIIRQRKKALGKVGVMLGDARSIYWNLSVKDNLKYFAALRGIFGRKARLRIEFLAESLDFNKVLMRRVGELSRGIRQRILLAISLLPNPRLLILDEPTFGLDITSRYDIRRFLYETVSNGKCSIVIATHQMDEAQQFAGHICILNEGKIIEKGPLRELIKGGSRKYSTLDSGNQLTTRLEKIFIESIDSS